MPSQATISGIFVALGHISFALTFLSYAQKDLIKLRIIACASLFAGLLYNAYVNYHMPPGQDIRLVLFWLLVFFAQNAYLLVRQIQSTLEISLPTEMRQLLVQSFTKMHSRDWKAFVAQAETKTAQQQAVA